MELQLTNPDYLQEKVITTELLLTCCCPNMLAKYIVIFSKFYQSRVTSSRVISSRSISSRARNNKINHLQSLEVLINGLTKYQQKTDKVLYCNIDCYLSRLKQQKSHNKLLSTNTYLTWFKYTSDRQGYFQLYSDLMDLYLFINYHLSY